MHVRNVILLCPDIDECVEGTAGCAQMCTNVNGSYSCSCGSGYLLAIDEHGCEGTVYNVILHMYQYWCVDNFVCFIKMSMNVLMRT